MAAFSITNGRASRAAMTNTSLSAIAPSAPTPTVTSTPARRSSARPRPFTAGLGSRMAATTRRTPAPTSAGAQGGVRPWCAQGSRVT
jgi:hypothetical protein